jgi:hypothetical protein
MPLNFAEAPVTPKKKKFDSGEEQLIDDSDSAEELKEESDAEDSASNEDEESENEAEKEAAVAEAAKKKLEEMKQFAEDNGISLTFEKEKPKVEAKKPWKMTPELLARIHAEDDARFMEKMKKYIPPPLEILKKQYTTDEPVRTGFNQGLLPVKIKNNVEYARTAQGPQIIVTS